MRRRFGGLKRLIAATAAVTLCAVAAAAAPKRPLEVEDFDRLAAVDGVVCSRDGREIAYTVEQSDLDSDERKTAIWMIDFDGRHDRRLTAARGIGVESEIQSGRPIPVLPGDARRRFQTSDLSARSARRGTSGDDRRERGDRRLRLVAGWPCSGGLQGGGRGQRQDAAADRHRSAALQGGPRPAI